MGKLLPDLFKKETGKASDENNFNVQGNYIDYISTAAAVCNSSGSSSSSHGATAVAVSCSSSSSRKKL